MAHIYDPTSVLTGLIVSNFDAPIRNGGLKVKILTISPNSQSRIGTQYVIDCTNGALGSRSGTFLTEFNVGAWHNITFRNTSGVGTYMYWNVDVDQGTYDVQIFTLHNSYGGQFTVKRTGVAIGGTIDTYAAASTPSVDTITGVTFAQGVAMIRLDVTGKNASASSYTIQLTKIILTRVS